MDYGDYKDKGSISDFWVEEKNKFLREKLPKDVQEKPFYPNAYFYAQYYNDNLKGLHYMAGIIFDLLKIEPDNCVIDFYNDGDIQKGALSGDAAGFYTKIKDEDSKDKEVIFINSKHKNNPLAVGAILAHEMMHLYLFRLGLKLENTHENELLTDLATINAGLPLLILNGMRYSSHWYLTIIALLFGRIYWHSEELAFGYFKPKEYGEHALTNLKNKGLNAEDVIGYLTPVSRHFISHNWFSKGKETTEFIKILDKQHKKSNIIKGAIVTVIVGGVLIWGQISDSNKNSLSSQINDCKAQISNLEKKVKNERENLDGLSIKLDSYENLGDEANYNKLVNPYNSLLIQEKTDYANYQKLLKDCNIKIDEYNKKYVNN